MFTDKLNSVYYPFKKYIVDISSNIDKLLNSGTICKISFFTECSFCAP